MNADINYQAALYEYIDSSRILPRRNESHNEINLIKPIADSVRLHQDQTYYDFNIGWKK